MKYRKKSVVIDAVQWRGNNTEEISSFVDNNWKGVDKKLCTFIENDLIITTLVGNIIVDINDWIIKSPVGGFCFCRPDVFEQTYEGVE